MSKSEAFSVSFKNLEVAAIKELLQAHPGALPISCEWKVKNDHDGAVVIWWIPSPVTRRRTKKAGGN